MELSPLAPWDEPFPFFPAAIRGPLLRDAKAWSVAQSVRVKMPEEFRVTRREAPKGLPQRARAAKTLKAELK